MYPPSHITHNKILLHFNSVQFSSIAQSCPTLYDTIDCSPTGSSVRGNSPGQEYWSGLPCHPLGDLPKPGMEPRSPALQADSLLSESPGKPILKKKIHYYHSYPAQVPSLLLSPFAKVNSESFSSVQFSHSVMPDSL